MSLDQLAAIASIVASCAVVISLIFIALQLRQNAHLTRMAAAQTSAQLLSQNFGRVIEHADVAELIARAASEDPATWPPADYLRVTNFLSVSFRHFEVLHTHRRYGIFEEELWLGSESRLRNSLESAGVRTWWTGTRQNYAKSFATFVDEISAEYAARDNA